MLRCATAWSREVGSNMRTITQRELRNQSAAIMDAVESGETLRITRNGVEVAEIRPAPGSPLSRMDKVLERFQDQQPIDLNELRGEADDLFGPDDLGEPAGASSR